VGSSICSPRGVSKQLEVSRSVHRPLWALRGVLVATSHAPPAFGIGFLTCAISGDNAAPVGAVFVLVVLFAWVSATNLVFRLVPRCVPRRRLVAWTAVVAAMPIAAYVCGVVTLSWAQWRLAHYTTAACALLPLLVFLASHLAVFAWATLTPDPLLAGCEACRAPMVPIGLVRGHRLVTPKGLARCLRLGNVPGPDLAVVARCSGCGIARLEAWDRKRCTVSEQLDQEVVTALPHLLRAPDTQATDARILAGQAPTPWP
jgi:hypothetical protein